LEISGFNKKFGFSNKKCEKIWGIDGEFGDSKEKIGVSSREFWVAKGKFWVSNEILGFPT